MSLDYLLTFFSVLFVSLICCQVEHSQLWLDFGIVSFNGVYLHVSLVIDNAHILLSDASLCPDIQSRAMVCRNVITHAAILHRTHI